MGHTVTKSDFTKYVEDNIEGMHWEWAWNHKRSGKYDFASHSPIPTCPHCKGYLVVKDHPYGGNSLLSAGLIDECHLLLNPIVLGGGKRAMPDNLRMRLELLGEHRFRSGVVHLHYRVIV